MYPASKFGCKEKVLGGSWAARKSPIGEGYESVGMNKIPTD